MLRSLQVAKIKSTDVLTGRDIIYNVTPVDKKEKGGPIYLNQ